MVSADTLFLQMFHVVLYCYMKLFTVFSIALEFPSLLVNEKWIDLTSIWCVNFPLNILYYTSLLFPLSSIFRAKESDSLFIFRPKKQSNSLVRLFSDWNSFIIVLEKMIALYGPIATGHPVDYLHVLPCEKLSQWSNVG
jgi:hypothetical protein